MYYHYFAQKPQRISLLNPRQNLTCITYGFYYNYNETEHRTSKLRTMNPKNLISAVLAAITCIVLIPTVSTAQTDPVFPTGSLSATPKTVYPGVYPVLTWDITYPETVTDVIDIEVPGIITPKEDLYMDVRVLGASVGTQSGIWATVQGWVRADGSSNWQNFFSGKQPDVDPTRIYFTKLIRKNQPNHFGGRHYWYGWQYFYNTTMSSTQNIIALVKGSTPPTYAGGYDQQDVEAFLQPYVDSNGKIDIGPMDVIYLIETTHTDTSSSGFDMQDLVLLVTFRRVPTNHL